MAVNKLELTCQIMLEHYSFPYSQTELIPKSPYSEIILEVFTTFQPGTQYYKSLGLSAPIRL